MQSTRWMKGLCSGVKEFRCGERHSCGCAADDENEAIVQKSRSVSLASCRHEARGCERAGRGIVDFGLTQRLICKSNSTGDKNTTAKRPRIGAERCRGVTEPGGEHVAGRLKGVDECAAATYAGVEQLRGGKWTGIIAAAGDEYIHIGQERSRVVHTGHG